MGDALKVSSEGLHVLAVRCDTAAAALTTAAAPTGGPSGQATTVAVDDGHALVHATMEAFAARATDTAAATRAAAMRYTDTDQDSKQNLAAVVRSI